MKMKCLASCLRLTALALLAGSALAAGAADSSSIQVRLQNTGMDADAAGTALASLQATSSRFIVSASGLTPGHSYTLTVGDISEATLIANTKGRVSIQFKTPPKPNTPVLDFDPRNQLLALRDGTNSVLQALFSGSSEPTNIVVDERAKLERLAGTGEATARYQVSPNGSRTLTVQLQKVTGTNWSLYVNGLLRGTVPVKRSGNGSTANGTLVFKSKPGSSHALLLNFDPRGQVVDLAEGSTLMFSGTLTAKIKNVNLATPSAQQTLIPSTGADADGTASARLRVDSEARRRFSIELENVPVGAYELLANGLWQGNIQVTTNVSGTHGQLEFSSRADDNGHELPLTFDPTNTTFIIQQGATIFFQGLPTFGTTSSNNAPVLLNESLTSTHLVPAASGDAKFEIDNRGRHKFSVEIENVSVGSYALLIAGTQRGILHAQLKNGKVKGELEFSSSPDVGELPLNFDPRGQLLEITGTNGALFANLFGVGGTNNTATVPLRFQLPLFNTSTVSNATAKVAFQRDEKNRRSFSAEIENLPVGDYTLLVGGVVRATVSVVTTSLSHTRGQVEFSDEAEAGELPLTFDPLGQEVVLSQNTTNYFGRVLPDGN